MNATLTSMPPGRLRYTAGRYLKAADFGQMLFAAAILHVLVIAVLFFWPKTQVTEIPVRTLKITLGSSDMSAAINPPPAPVISAYRPPVPVQAPLPEVVPEAPAKSESEVFKAPEPEIIPKPKVKPKPQPRTEKRVPIAQDRREPTQQSIPANVPPKKVAIKKAVSSKPALKPKPQKLPKYFPPDRPASKAVAAPVSSIAATPLAPPSAPKQYVRQTRDSSASEKATAGQNVQQIRARYEQQISAWLQRHRVVPKMARQLGQHGTPVLRVRIDRSGAAKYFAIERGSGYELIDKAAMDMVRRATPFPKVPEGYPGGQVIEFLIPVLFDLK